ncbi:hypothetical protein [Parasitella parasitica]|uniref:Reverse transcriptase zinc-binding domain-containing protein n=1 Tax=Parasitella parasitica TaxID=35722 RepID=A0A0B7MWY5_9FUNG|nr:hypothetical protein [Parasitella parasitica]
MTYGNIRSFCSSLLVPSTSASSSSSYRRPGRIPLNSITYYRSLLPSLPLPSPLSSANTKWSRLWSLVIPLSSRTVWYRALHLKIPTKSLLHRLMPQQHSSPLCTLCSGQVEEDLHHFLFTCSLKFQVWRSIFQTYISPLSLSDCDLVNQLVTTLACSDTPLIRVNHMPCTLLSTYQIFACTLLAVWQAHWRMVFDGILLFLPHSVLQRTIRSFSRLEDELRPDF